MPSTSTAATTRRGFLVGSAAVATAALAGPGRAAESPSLTWSRTYVPGTGKGLIRDIVPTSGGFALVGLADGSDYRGWIGRVDEHGRSGAHRLLGTPGTWFATAAPAPTSGGILAAGVTNESVDKPGPDHADPYAVMHESDDDVQWARTYQPAAPGGGANAIVRLGERYVVAGNTTSDGAARPWATAIDVHGTAGWEWEFDPSGREGGVEAAVAVTDGVVVAGSIWPTTASDHGRDEAAWLAKLTPSGGQLWRRTFDRARGDRIEAVAPSGDGGVVALGRRGFATRDRGVGWVTALDANGTQQWSRTYPQADDRWNWHHAVVPLADGYLLLGTRDEQGGSDRGAWLTRVNERGAVCWDYQAPPGTRGYALQPLADGGILLGGDRSRENETAAWLAKLGGTAAPPRSGGVAIPSPPDWLTSASVGIGLGALGTEAIRRYRGE